MPATLGAREMGVILTHDAPRRRSPGYCTSAEAGLCDYEYSFVSEGTLGFNGRILSLF